MKSISKIIASWLLIIALLFNVVGCGILPDINLGNKDQNQNTDGEFSFNAELTATMKVGETLTIELVNTVDPDGQVIWTSSSSCATVENGVITALKAGTTIVKATLGEKVDRIIITITDGESGEKPEEKPEEPPFGSEYSSITIEEARAIAEQYSSSASTEMYYLVATITDMKNASKGEMDIADDTGSIYVYRCTLQNGESLDTTDIDAGYLVVIYGTLRNYKGKLEVEDGQIIKYLAPDGSSGDNSGDNTGDNTGNNGGSTITPPTTDDPITSDPYVGVNKTEFYETYTPAISYNDAYYRTQHGLMSGSIDKQDQAPTISTYQPKQNGKYVRNNDYIFSADGNIYYVVDAYGEIVMEIYRGGAYVVLEEVAAYVFAFGEPPSNHSASKNTSPSSSVWGIYLRVNNTVFSGSTSKYPYEPELPRISGCGGDLTYYEMDIGTTGTDCDPSYDITDYNNGYKITRGAARIVYSAKDKNGNKIIDLDERYVFYTYNHYNDFQEYLNYFGGWGEMFGNITGGGSLSSKYNYNPTPYVEVIHASLNGAQVTVVYYYVPKNEYVA